MHTSRPQRRRQIAGAFLALSGLAQLVLGAIAPGAQAQPVPAGNVLGFEADGNQAADGGIDWADIDPTVLYDTGLTKNEPDNGFQGASKEEDTSTWTCQSKNGGIEPSKANLLRAYVYPDLSMHAGLLAMGFVREKVTGDTYVNVELNQGTTTFDEVTCEFTGRVVGDLLFEFAFPGNGAADVSVWRWDGTAWADTALTDIAALVKGDDNAGPIVDAVHLAETGETVELPARAFGEVAMDFVGLHDAIDPNGAGACRTYSSVFIRSRSASGGLTSALQDFISPAHDPISTCGTISLTKTDDHGNALPGVVFELHTSSAPAAGATPVATCTTDAAGRCEFHDIVPGSYWVFENAASLPAGYQPVDGPLAPGEIQIGVATNTDLGPIVNPRRVGDLRIEKVLETLGGQPVTIADLSKLDGAEFTLYDDADGSGSMTADEIVETWTGGTPATCTIAGGTASCDITGIATGGYRLTETAVPAGTMAGDDMDVTISANADGTPALETVTFANIVSPVAISLDKVGPNTATIGDTITYTFTVSNGGDENLTDVTLTDLGTTEGGNTLDRCDQDPALVSGDTGNDGILGVNEAWVYTCEHTIDPTDADLADDVLSNRAEVEAVDVLGRSVSATSAHDVQVLRPALTIVKTPDAGQIAPGDDLEFTILVTNSGNGRADDLVISDELPAGFTWTSLDTACTIITGATDTLRCTLATLAAGDSISVKASAPTTATDCGDIPNTAAAEAAHASRVTDGGLIRIACPPVAPPPVNPPQPPAAAQDPAAVPAPAIGLDKTGPTMAHRGDTVTYTFTVTNLGDTELAAIDLDDPLCDQDTLATLDDGNGDSVLGLGETWTMACTHVVAEDTADPLPNVATVSASAGTQSVSASDDHLVDVIDPAITVDKSVDNSGPQPGDTITFSYSVLNSGDIALHDVEVIDDILGLIGVVPVLAPGETVVLTATQVVTADQPLTNVAVARGTDPLDVVVTSQDDETISIVLTSTIEAPATPGSPVAPAAPTLPRTGTSTAVLLLAAGLMLITGGSLNLGSVALADVRRRD